MNVSAGSIPGKINLISVKSKSPIRIADKSAGSGQGSQKNGLLSLGTVLHEFVAGTLIAVQQRSIFLILIQQLFVGSILDIITKRQRVISTSFPVI